MSTNPSGRPVRRSSALATDTDAGGHVVDDAANRAAGTDWAATVPTAEAATFLAVPGVQGESTTVGHEGDIEVHDVQWRLHRAAPDSIRRGRQPHRIVADDVVVTAAMDRSAPALLDHLVKGRVTDTMRISWTRSVGPEVVSLELENVMVTSYRVTSSASLPAVRIALASESARLRVREINADGSAGADHEVEFDLETAP